MTMTRLCILEKGSRSNRATTASPIDALLVADGTSCRHQIHDGASRVGLHVARVLAMSLDAANS